MELISRPDMLGGILDRIRSAISRRFLNPLATAARPRMIYDFDGIEGTRVSTSAIFNGRRENVRLGRHVFVGHYVFLDGEDALTVGDGVQLSAGACLLTHSSHIAIRLQGDRYLDSGTDRPGWIGQPLCIGPYTFLGVNATVLAGCDVGRAAVVAAHALVTKPVPAYAIVAGVPARIVGDVRELDRDFIDPSDDWWPIYRAVIGDE